jgi:glutamine---fructose-6-phosphate transaminase (isomerizing)
MTEPDTALLFQEIGEQPAVIARVLDAQRPTIERLAASIRGRDPHAIVLVARGSSDNAAVFGRYLLEVCNRRLVSLAAASSLTLYGSAPDLTETLVIGVSQSGQGEDVVAYLREARHQGAATVAIVNDEQSPLANAAEWVLPCLAGPELSVPATKTVTAQMALLAMLSAALGDDTAASMAVLSRVPDAVGRALEARSGAARLARALAGHSIGSVIGRGFAFPPALEIALKLKETSYTRAEPFSAADFLHGPVALVEPEYFTLLVDVGGRSTHAALEMLAAVKARGGQPAVLRAADSDLEQAIDAPHVALHVDVPEAYAPIVVLVLGQLLAVELALARGLDPARPRGLRKVTSTR